MPVPSQRLGKLIVGYFPSWAVHARNYHLSDIPADKITHLNYAFACISDAGKCASINALDDQVNFAALSILKQKHPSLVTLISVGGASHSTNFAKAAKTAEARQLLVKSCIAFLKRSGFDGIDVCWELPGANDKQEYSALIRDLRSQLDAQGAADGKHYLLTAALPAGPAEYANIDLGQVHQHLDWINLLAFDFYTALDSDTHLSAPLYACSSDPEPNPAKRSSSNVNAAVEAYLSAGIPAAKLVIGVPSFGVGWEGVPDTNNGLYQPASGAAQATLSKNGIFDFRDLNSNYVGNYLRFWSSEASSPWLFNPKAGIMISYDDPQSLCAKADYIIAKNLGGAMIWQLSGDDAQSSLLQALSNRLNSPKGDDAPTALPLDVSSREILKGTLVRPKLSRLSDLTHNLPKYGAIRQLALTQEETNLVHEHLQMTGRLARQGRDVPQISAPTLDLLRSFERPIVPALRPGISAVATIPADELTVFAKAVVEVRAMRVRAAQENQLPAVTVGEMMQSLNSAIVAAQSLELNTAVQPLGMLNLERIEMVPAGIQRGELIATIPLAPGEETAVTHKEWSVSSKEFTSIVTDSLEETSETGVTDNTNLSQSTTSQNQHSNQFNITATVQGGIPIINGSTTAGATAQEASSASATDSIKHATSITRKAAARSRQEHKTTISTKTVTGTSEVSTRILKNTSTTDPIRIDYFSLMRKWRVRLYRLGLRLTYDLVVPEPGAAMRRAYMELDNLRDKIGAFIFPIKTTDLSNDPVNKDTGKAPAPGDATIPRYQWYADQVRTWVPPYPADPHPITPDATHDGSQQLVKFPLEFDVPPNTAIKQIFLDLNINRDFHGGDMAFNMLGTQFWPAPLKYTGEENWIEKHHEPLFDAPGSPNLFLAGRTGHQKIWCLVNDGENIIVQLTVELENLPSVREKWREDAWNALYNAAQVNYYAQQQDIMARITAIEDRLANVDTLTLRREENDEIMKSVLKFILGTNFDLMPEQVRNAFNAAKVDVEHGVGFEGSKFELNNEQWAVVRQHENIVRFINEAVEWENVVTFLYSYFWDVPESWPFIRNLRHSDATRQAFLRAGCARVVLTIRKGWEEKWKHFAEHLATDVDIPNPTMGPYLSIAQEIAAYDDRNYPGIPPANPGKAAVRLQDAVFTTSSAKINQNSGPVSIPVDSRAGFVIGLPVVLDVEDGNHIQEAPVITDIHGDHIVVDKLVYPHDGTQVPFPVLQPGDKGTLIAEWNEYTQLRHGHCRYL